MYTLDISVLVCWIYNNKKSSKSTALYSVHNSQRWNAILQTEQRIKISTFPLLRENFLG
jgi:hypothetical protein